MYDAPVDVQRVHLVVGSGTRPGGQGGMDAAEGDGRPLSHATRFTQGTARVMGPQDGEGIRHAVIV
jgi:hypothetical protein